MFTLLVMLMSPSADAATIVGSKHDFSSASTSTYKGGTAQTCIYCHTPHNASVTNTTPLWNHTDSAAVFTMYTVATSATYQSTTAATPGGVSLACLACHDGTISVSSYLRGPAGGNTNVKVLAGANAYVGTDLRNDHPVSFTYDSTKDTGNAGGATGLVARASLPTSLPLFGVGADQVECGTCHNVHDSAIPYFLRVSNNNSALCTACHIK